MKTNKVLARRVSGIEVTQGYYTWVCNCPRCSREIVFTIAEELEPRFRCECPFCWNPIRDKSAYSFMVKFL